MSSHLPISGALSEFDFATILAQMHGQALDGQLKIATARFTQDTVAGKRLHRLRPIQPGRGFPGPVPARPRRHRRSAFRKKPAPHAEEPDPPRPGAAGNGHSHARAIVDRGGGPSARHRLFAVHPAHGQIRHRAPARKAKARTSSSIFPFPEVILEGIRRIAGPGIHRGALHGKHGAVPGPARRPLAGRAEALRIPRPFPGGRSRPAGSGGAARANCSASTP